MVSKSPISFLTKHLLSLLSQWGRWIVLVVFVTSVAPLWAGDVGAVDAAAVQLSKLDSLQQIEEVVVNAMAIREVVPSQSMGGEELKRLNSHSVSDALKHFSGVQIKDYGGIGGLKSVNVRSLGSQHVGVFYDGVQIGNAQNGTVDLGRFSLDNMEMISVYNGQKSNTLQSAKDYASASALYMVSRRPVFENGVQNNWSAKLKGGSFDMFNSSLLWEHKISDKLKSSVNVEFLNTSGKYRYKYKVKDGYQLKQTRRNGDIIYMRGEVALYGVIKRGEWQTKLYFYGSKRGYPGAVVREGEGTVLRNEGRQRDRTFFVQSSLEQQLSTFYSYKLKAKYSNDFSNYIMPASTSDFPANNRYTQQELYFSFANLFNLTKFWAVGLSSDIQLNSLNATGLLDFNDKFTKPRRFGLLNALSTTFDFNKFTLQGSLLHTFNHDWSAKNLKTAKDKSIFTPAVVASYKPFNRVDLDFRAFYKKIFRLPTFNDLYYVNIGNRSLKPEYTTQYNLGAVYAKQFKSRWFRSLRATVDLYYNEVKDKIVAYPTYSQQVWTMMNVGYVEIRGVDATLATTMRFGKFQLDARAAYTYQKAQDYTPEDIPEGENIHIDSYYGDQIAYTPWHSGSFVLSGSYGRWGLNYSVVYTGERYVSSANIAKNRLKPWQTHDLSLSRSFGIGSTELMATAEVNNIFNQQYDVVKNYPMPGRNFMIILTLNF